MRLTEGFLKVLAFSMILVASMVSVRTAFSERGFVVKDDMAFPLSDEQAREALSNKFFVWYGKIGGGFAPALPSSIPFWAWYNLLNLVLNTELVAKLFIVMLFTLAGCSMYVLSKRLMSFPSSLLAAFLYMFNPWTFDRIASGHLNLLMGYALAPIPLMFVYKLRERVDIKDYILTSLSLALMLSFTVHFFALVLILAVFYMLFMVIFSRESRSKSGIVNVVSVFAVALLLNSFWLLPVLANYSLVKTSMIEPAVAGAAVETINQQAKILNTLRLTGYWLPYFRDYVSGLGVLSSIWSVFSFDIPILAFLGLLYSRKDKRMIFLGAAAVIFLFPTMIASSNPSVFLQAINYFPPLALFRDSYKFVGVVCLCYGVLIGSLFDNLCAFVSKRRADSVGITGGTKIRKGKIFLANLVLGLILISTITFATPNLLSGDFGGQLSILNPPSYWLDVRDFLANESAWRVLWVPPFASIHYKFANQGSIDPVDEYLTSLYAASLKSTNPSLHGYLSHLTSLLYEDHYISSIGQLLAPLSIKYVVLRLDGVPQWISDQHTSVKLQEVMKNQQGLTRVFESGKWVVFENTYAAPFITAPSLGAILVFDDFSATKSLVSLFENEMPPLLYADSEGLSQSDIEKLIALSNSLANVTNLTLAIPIEKSPLASNLIEQIKGKTEFIYFIEGEDLLSEAKSVVPNYSFEDGLDHWCLGNQAFSLRMSEDAVDGQNSLEVSTDCNASLCWSWISSEEICVLPNTIYEFGTNIKQFNAMQSHAKVIGFDETIGEWETICFAPIGMDGNLAWAPYKWTFDSRSFTKIEVILNAGWVSDPSAGNATAFFDDITVRPILSYSSSFGNASALPLDGLAQTVIHLSNASSYRIGLKALSPVENTVEVRLHNDEIDQAVNMSIESNSLDFFYSQPIHPIPGEYTLEITSEKPVDIDTLAVFSVNQENETLQCLVSQEVPATVITSERINPTSYIAKINSTDSFLLSFSEAYDPSWTAYVNGQRVESVPLCSAINGFWVNQTGQLNITIEYEPQRWFYYGSVASIATLIACIACTTYISMKNKNIWSKCLPRVRR